LGWKLILPNCTPKNYYSQNDPFTDDEINLCLTFLT